MSICSQITFSPSNNGKKFVLSMLALKRFDLLQLLIRYVEQKKIDKEYVMPLKRVAPFSHGVCNIPEFSKVDQSGLANIYIKPLKGLPSIMPHWFREYNMMGIWTFLNFKITTIHEKGTILTIGETLDIQNSLKILLKERRNLKMTETHKWIAALSFFFHDVLSKQNNYVHIKCK